MLDVVNDQLVVEEKGIYSIEKFIVARRFMYWQVYLHRTVLSAEFMLVNAMKRAKELAMSGTELFCSPSLRYFLYNEITKGDFEKADDAIRHYAQLDDFDITGALKVWQTHDDKILSILASKIIQRDLFKIELRKERFAEEHVNKLIEEIAKRFSITESEARYFVINESVDNKAYSNVSDTIKVLMKNGTVRDAAEVSDHLNIAALSQPVEKHFVAYAEN